MQQVDKKSYNFFHYSYPDRWASYFYQLREVLSVNPNSILEIGVGDKVFQSFIKNNTHISYTSLDIAVDLEPDIIAHITDTRLPSNTYDVVCAFEVLEHIPFEEFNIAIKELCRISKKYLIISLPHFGPVFQFYVKVPFLPKVQFVFKIPFAKKHTFNGQHYWEIGKKGFSLGHIINDIEQHGTIISHYIPFENQYHHFFVIEKRDAIKYS